MMMAALIMRPWIIIMRTCGAACLILAGDILIMAKGKRMMGMFAKALNATHKYLKAMGGKVAPSTSYNFVSNSQATRWLNRTWWEHIEATFKVANYFRYI